VIALPSARPLVIGVPVNRDLWGFSARDRRVMNELRPHLAQAHMTAKTRQLLQQAVASRDAALDRLGSGVARISGDRIVDASPVAARWLRRGLIEGGRPTDALLSWYATERSRFDGDETLPSIATTFTARDDRAEAAIRFIGDDTILLRERAHRTDPDELQRFGLSAAEAAVLARIVEGATTTEAAAALFIVPDTVRKHLSNAYRKLGVHSRASAVAFVLGAIAGGTG
jgi:DNA-binding CsgD family transcriptional regulator